MPENVSVTTGGDGVVGVVGDMSSRTPPRQRRAQRANDRLIGSLKLFYYGRFAPRATALL